MNVQTCISHRKILIFTCPVSEFNFNLYSYWIHCYISCGDKINPHFFNRARWLLFNFAISYLIFKWYPMEFPTPYSISIKYFVETKMETHYFFITKMAVINIITWHYNFGEKNRVKILWIIFSCSKTNASWDNLDWTLLLRWVDDDTFRFVLSCRRSP